jgi:hypothetical protein
MSKSPVGFFMVTAVITSNPKQNLNCSNFFPCQKLKIQEEVKRRLNSGNACYHSMQNLLSSRLLSKNVVRIYNTIILPVVLYGCETWSLTVREEHKLRVFRNRVLRRILVQRGME